MDQIVLDMATQSEGSASIFVKKDWLSILDNQNKNYQGSQSIIDTSQLANSNKYMNYREAYITVPLTMTLTGTGLAGGLWTPLASAGSDFPLGLKNWYGSIIHSFTLDYNGTTIIQQTPLCGLYNTFKLMTSLSLNDIKTQGALIGFFPDTAQAASFAGAAGAAPPAGGGGVPLYNSNGSGVCNNINGIYPQVMNGFANGEDVSTGNLGFLQRQNAWCINPELATTAPSSIALINATYMSQQNFSALWNSYVNKVSNAVAAGGVVTLSGVWQASILAVIQLKHIHSFFERVPLLKGVFMKLTFNLNQPYVTFDMGAAANAGGTNGCPYANVQVVSPLGGVNPLMLASAQTFVAQSAAGAGRALSGGSTLVVNTPQAAGSTSYCASLVVGNVVTAPHPLVGAPALSNLTQMGSGSILLNVPAYTFNPVFESSYLASPVKKIVYSDIYQYQILNQITAAGTFNNLVTNGIANIKSVLVIPFFSAGTTAAPIANSMGISPIYSPFDTAGGGTTSPWVQFNQFNIQISGQNAIYNTERYGYEQFVNQLKGYGAINGGQEDGLTSGLIGYDDWKKGYSYYYVNCGRMLPVEEAVPKSVNIIGNNASAKAVDLYVFVEYGVEVSVDILTGARV